MKDGKLCCEKCGAPVSESVVREIGKEIVAILGLGGIRNANIDGSGISR